VPTMLMYKKTILLHILLHCSTLSAAPRLTTEQVGCLRAAMHNLRYDTLLGAMGPDNLRAVVPGTLYRGNTLWPATFAHYIEALGLRTIINLRGEHFGESWWDEESAVARDKGITLHNLAMKPHAYPTPTQVGHLLSLFAEVQEPVFVHCRSGVDRAATVSGLWLIEKGASSEVALHQLSFTQFGHVGFLFPQMRSFLALWHALRTRFNREDATREYAAIYEELDLAAHKRMYRLQRPLEQCLARIGVIIAALHNGAYVATKSAVFHD